MVTVWPARTAKDAAVPRFTVVAAKTANPPKVIKMAPAPSPSATPTQRARPLFCYLERSFLLVGTSWPPRLGGESCPESAIPMLRDGEFLISTLPNILRPPSCDPTL